MLVPICQHVRTLNAARLAADVEGVPTVLLCRTDAYSAQLLTSDIDERDRPFITGERTPEGFFCIRPEMGVEYAIAGSLPGDQVFPQLSLKTSGGYIVWQDNITDGSGLGISAQRLDSSRKNR